MKPPRWESIYEEEVDRLEVPGGWIYRTTLWSQEEPWVRLGATTCFVPHDRTDFVTALSPIAAAYPDDPGTSDLDDGQPVTITLGDVRRVWRALAGLR